VKSVGGRAEFTDEPKEDQVNKLFGSYWYRDRWSKMFFGLVVRARQADISASAERWIKFGVVSTGSPGKQTLFGSARGVFGAMNITEASFAEQDRFSPS